LTTVTISQSNYLPWRGYFSQIQNSDFFVFLDNVQFTRRDWRTRNQIRTPQGAEWLNIPISKSESQFELIENVRILNDSFLEKHLETIRRNYSRAKHFNPNWVELQTILCDSYNENLSTFNQKVIENISERFRLKCSFMNAGQFENSTDATERLLNICLALNATKYQTGPKAKSYLDVARFNSEGIEVIWSNYELKKYDQLWNLDFDPNVSVVDLILNVGFEIDYLKPLSGL
jgi:hypothetical protein